MSKVYVVQENNHVDYSDAERFGELVFITNSELKPISGSIINERIVSDLGFHLKNYSANDFLVLTGNPATIGLAFHYAARASESVNVLMWDKIHGRYKHLKIEVR